MIGSALEKDSEHAPKGDTMKAKSVGMMMFVSVVMSLDVVQADTLILCKFKSSPRFLIAIQTDEDIPVHDYFGQKYPAKVTFAGPRLWNESQEILEVDYINTRVNVGSSYYVRMGKNEEISLSSLWWPRQKPLSGTYTSNGKIQVLACVRQVEDIPSAKIIESEAAANDAAYAIGMRNPTGRR